MRPFACAARTMLVLALGSVSAGQVAEDKTKGAVDDGLVLHAVSFLFTDCHMSVTA